MKSLISVRRRYARFFLSQNPFPYISIPGEDPDYYFDQKAAIEKLRVVVQSASLTGLSNHAVLVAPYGCGKSHTLKFLEGSVNAWTRRKKPQALGIYVPYPGSCFLDLYRQIISAFTSADLAEMFERSSKSVKSESEIHRVLEHIRNGSEHSLNAWRWLVGERLELHMRNKVGVGRNVDDEAAMRLLKQIILLARGARHSPFCIMIDELETVNELNIVKRQRLFNSLRRFIDDNPFGLCLFFACTPAGWDEILENSFALARRLSRNVVYLESLDEKRIAEVLAGHVRKCRTKPRSLARYARSLGLTGKDLKSALQLYPVGLDAIPEIFRLSRGNVGEVLKYCNVAIDRALEFDHPIIDAKLFNNLTADFQR